MRGCIGWSVSSRCAFVSLSVLLYLDAFNAYVIKQEPFQGSKRKGASWPVTTPCAVVKLNSKVVKPNSDRKMQRTDSFFCLTLRSIFTCKLIRLNKSYAKEPLLAFLKAILVRVYVIHLEKHWVISYPLRVQWRLWSVCADAQADLSRRWVHMPFCWFYHAAAQMSTIYD